MSLLSEAVATVVNTATLVIEEPPVPKNAMKVSVAKYSYAEVGGDVGTYALPLTVPLPQGSVRFDFTPRTVFVT